MILGKNEETPLCLILGCLLLKILHVVISNPDIRSARLYGQFSLEKTWTLQAGSTVHSPTQSVFLIQVPGRDEADAIRPGPGDESQPFQNYGNLTCQGDSAVLSI